MSFNDVNDMRHALPERSRASAKHTNVLCAYMLTDARSQIRVFRIVFVGDRCQNPISRFLTGNQHTYLGGQT